MANPLFHHGPPRIPKAECDRRATVEVDRPSGARKLPDLCGVRKGERFRMMDAAGHWGPWMIACADAELKPVGQSYGRERLGWVVTAKREEREHA